MKVARCAAARKLLQPTWAIATKRQIFNLTHGQVRPSPLCAGRHLHALPTCIATRQGDL